MLLFGLGQVRVRVDRVASDKVIQAFIFRHSKFRCSSRATNIRPRSLVSEAKLIRCNADNMAIFLMQAVYPVDLSGVDCNSSEGESADGTEDRTRVSTERM